MRSRRPMQLLMMRTCAPVTASGSNARFAGRSALRRLGPTTRSGTATKEMPLMRSSAAHPTRWTRSESPTSGRASAAPRPSAPPERCADAGACAPAVRPALARLDRRAPTRSLACNSGSASSRTPRRLVRTRRPRSRASGLRSAISCCRSSGVSARSRSIRSRSQIGSMRTERCPRRPGSWHATEADRCRRRRSAPGPALRPSGSAARTTQHVRPPLAKKPSRRRRDSPAGEGCRTCSRTAAQLSIFIGRWQRAAFRDADEARDVRAHDVELLRVGVEPLEVDAGCAVGGGRLIAV